MRLRTISIVKAGLLLTALFLLSSCVRYNMDVTLFADNRAQVQIDFAIQDDFVSYLGEDPATLRDSLQSDLAGDVPDGTNFEVYASDGWTGSRLIIPEASITELPDLNNIGIPMQVTREGEVFNFTADAGDIVAEIDDFELGMPEGGLSDYGAEVIVTLTCPGAIVSSNGTHSEGNLVSWNLLATHGSMQAECLADGTGTIPAGVGGGANADETWFARWWPVLLAAFALLGGLVALATYLRRKAHADYDTWQNPTQQVDGIGGYWQNDDQA